MITKGISFMLIATLSFAIMNTMAKDLSELPAMQVVFFRALGSTVFIFPYMLINKISIRGNNPKLLALRAVVGLISLVTFFMVLKRIPLGSAISIRYIGPIFGVIMAYFLLKEKVSFWQWISFAIAFSGVIVLKGFDIRIDYFSLGLVLTSAFFVGIVYILLSYLGKREHYLTIINYFMMTSIFVSLVFCSNWRIPYSSEWVSVIGIGIFGLIGQVFMTRAFQLEETSLLAPFKYMELVYALILGFFFFGETYSFLAFSGILLIIVGMLLNIWAKQKKVVV